MEAKTNNVHVGCDVSHGVNLKWKSICLLVISCATHTIMLLSINETLVHVEKSLNRSNG